MRNQKILGFIGFIVGAVWIAWTSVKCKHVWVECKAVSIQPHPEHGLVAVQSVWQKCNKCDKHRNVVHTILEKDEKKLGVEVVLSK